MGNMDQPVLSLIKIFQIQVKKKSFPKEKLGKDNTVQTTFYLDLTLPFVFLIKTDQCFLNGPYSSNQIVCDSNFLNFKDF